MSYKNGQNIILHEKLLPKYAMKSSYLGVWPKNKKFQSFKKRREDPTEKIKRLVLRCIYFVKSKFSHHQQLVKIIELQKSMKVFQYQNEN